MLRYTASLILSFADGGQRQEYDLWARTEEGALRAAGAHCTKIQRAFGREVSARILAVTERESGRQVYYNPDCIRMI